MELHQKYKKAGYCLGPMDFPQKDEDARAFELALKEAEKEGGSYKRVLVTPNPQFEEGERAEISVISDSSLDSDREVVLSAGLTNKAFRKNPVVVWNHDYSIAPLGYSAWEKGLPVEGPYTKWIAKTIYAPRDPKHPAEQAWFPDTVLHLIKCGVLRGKSVGFLAQQLRAPSKKELELYPDWKNAKAIISKATLFEYSVVVLGANPNALVQEVNKCHGGEGIPADLLQAMQTEDSTSQKSCCWEWDESDSFVTPPAPKPKAYTPVRWDEVINKISRH